MAAIPLLRTKLFIPPLRAEWVARPRLIKRLVEAARHPLTLISAPAGFGKTTLLADWVTQGGQGVAWVTLDEGDSDPIRFWAYLIVALQTAQADLGTSVLGLLESPQPPPIESVLTVLLNELAGLDNGLTLILDDYHLIETQAIHEGITFLLDHLPPQLRLIITSRADPFLPLARLRARGQLSELRAADLRFTPEEAAIFLNEMMGLSLSATDIATLEAHTEGWIAGLQLAALSMQGRRDVAGFIEAFTGSHRFILDYLTDEVLGQRPQGTEDFLLQTSILERLCGPLCDALTGSNDGQATLERLEQANLFIVPLDDERRWYRYHHLFAEVLRTRLQLAHPDNVPDLHRRAWEWLEQNGLAHEAVNHALAGRDIEQAVRLIELVHSAMWQTGEIKTLQGWLAALPEASWRTHPRLWLIQAWAAMTVGEFSEADEKLQEAEEALALLDEESIRSLRPEIMAFRASYASFVRDSRAVELAQQALQELPKDYWLRGMLVVFLGTAYYTRGDLDAASNVLALAPGSTSLSTSNAKPHQIHLLVFGGMVHFAKGRLHDAWSLIHQALELAEPGGKPILFERTLLAYLSASRVLYERGELDQAEAYLTRCEAQAVKLGSTLMQVFALSGLAHISLARDDLVASANYTKQIDVLLRARAFTTNDMTHVEYHHFQLLLKQGNLKAAATWVESHAGQPRPLNPNAVHRLAQPQLLIAQGSFDAAMEKLADLIQEAQDTGHSNLLIKALVLQALALQAAGNNSQALITLERTLSLAEPEGFVRSFVDEGQPMAALLRQAQSRGIRPNYVSKLLAAFGAGEPGSRGAEVISPLLLRPSAPLLIESLTERELELLRLVAAGHSNQEIARALILAVGTVKKHLNNIFGKLGVSSRTQAVARAQELDLL